MNKKLEKQLDAIKDEIDDLHDLKSPFHRLEAATDLIEYIGIHIRDVAEVDVMERNRERAQKRARSKR